MRTRGNNALFFACRTLATLLPRRIPVRGNYAAVRAESGHLVATVTHCFCARLDGLTPQHHTVKAISLHIRLNPQRTRFAKRFAVSALTSRTPCASYCVRHRTGPVSVGAGEAPGQFPGTQPERIALFRHCAFLTRAVRARCDYLHARDTHEAHLSLRTSVHTKYATFSHAV